MFACFEHKYIFYTLHIIYHTFLNMHVIHIIKNPCLCTYLLFNHMIVAYYPKLSPNTNPY